MGLLTFSVVGTLGSLFSCYTNALTNRATETGPHGFCTSVGVAITASTVLSQHRQHYRSIDSANAALMALSPKDSTVIVTMAVCHTWQQGMPGMNALELAYLRGSPRTCTTHALDPNKTHILNVLYGFFRVQLRHVRCILFDAYRSCTPENHDWST